MSFFCRNNNSSLEPQVVFNCLRQGGWIQKSEFRIQELAFPKVKNVALTFPAPGSLLPAPGSEFRLQLLAPEF
jgi:hypothetical protein